MSFSSLTQIVDPCQIVHNQIIVSSDDKKAKQLVVKHLAVLKDRLNDEFHRLAKSIDKIDGIPFGSHYHRMQLLKPRLLRRKDLIPSLLEPSLRPMMHTLKKMALTLRTDTGSGAFYTRCTYTSKYLMNAGKKHVDDVRKIANISGIPLPFGGLSAHDYMVTNFTNDLNLMLSYKFLFDMKRESICFKLAIKLAAEGKIRTGMDDRMRWGYKPTRLTAIEQRAVIETVEQQRRKFAGKLFIKSLSMDREATENVYEAIYMSMNKELHSVNEK